MCAVAVEMSLPMPALGGGIALVRTRVAGTASILGLAGIWVFPFAFLADTASDGVGAGGDDGPVVVGIGVCCARDGGEEWVGPVAVPAGGRAHCAGVCSPGTDWADTRVSVLIVTGSALDIPELRVVTGERLLNGVLADDGVGVAEDVADVVAGPLANRVRFKDCSAVFDRMGLVAYAYLSIPLTQLHTAFGRAVAAGHYVTIAIGFVERYFVTHPVDDSICGGCFSQAVGLFVGEERARGREEEESRVYGSHVGALVCMKVLVIVLDLLKEEAGELNAGM